MKEGYRGIQHVALERSEVDITIASPGDEENGVQGEGKEENLYKGPGAGGMAAGGEMSLRPLLSGSFPSGPCRPPLEDSRQSKLKAPGKGLLSLNYRAWEQCLCV